MQMTQQKAKGAKEIPQISVQNIGQKLIQKADEKNCLSNKQITK